MSSNSPKAECTPLYSEPETLEPTAQDIEDTQKWINKYQVQIDALDNRLSELGDMEDDLSQSLRKEWSKQREKCLQRLEQSRKTHQELVEAVNRQNE